VTLCVCGLCGSEYFLEDDARQCHRKGAALIHLERTFIRGKFLLVGDKRVLPVNKLVFAQDAGRCLKRNLDVELADSNGDIDVMSYSDEIMTARSIPITEAVISYGWRAFSEKIWERRASLEMKEKYSIALKAIIGGMTDEERESALVRLIGFCQQ